jgi:UDP:flavonoid glycosyltransferase YjiC (YdhE family)
MPAGTNITKDGTILLVVGTGGFTHAGMSYRSFSDRKRLFNVFNRAVGPVLELGRILAQRGHRVEFATHRGQQRWVDTPYYDFISEVHLMGDAMDAATEAAQYLDLQDSDPRRSYRSYFRPKLAIDALWTSDLAHLKDIVVASRPDMIVADFFVDAVRDIQHQLGIPCAMVWPQMPYGMAKAPYIPGVPGFQTDAISSEHASRWTRIRAELRPFRALPAILSYLRFVRRMRRAAGVNYTLPLLGKPDHLALVNSFWGLEIPKELPPLIAAIGPILAEEYPALDPGLEAFFSSHKRVLYVSFGTHVQLQREDLSKFMGAVPVLFQDGLIDGVVWVANAAQRALFGLDHTVRMGFRSTTVVKLLNNTDPDWHFVSFAPQRAILDRAETVLFVTHGGGSSVNESTFHGTPMLGLGFFFDQPLNCLRVEEAGVGLALDKADFSAVELVDKCRLILEDKQGNFAKDVQRMRHIARTSSRKKHYGADLIEEVMYDRMFSREPLDHAPSSREKIHRAIARSRRPLHLQTADARMSAWRAKNWDLTLLGVTAFGSCIGIGYCAYHWLHRR